MAEISFEDFSKVELRVGEIVLAEKPEWSRKQIRLEVDFGDEGRKQVFTGLSPWYKPEDLVGKQAVFCTNLPPKKIENFVSEAMILAVETEKNDGFTILIPQNKAKNGAKIY